MAKASLKDQFSDLMSNFQSGPLIGLDIGLSAVKAAFLSHGRKGSYKLEKFYSIPLSEAAIIDDVVQKHEEIIQAIETIVKKMNLGNHRITNVGIDGNDTMTKRIQVPDAGKEDLIQNIIWEAEQYISFGAEESELDYSILRDLVEQDSKDVIVAAARDEIIEQYSDLATQANLIVKNVDLNVFALNNLFEVAYADQLDMYSEEGVILIDLGAQKTTIIVYKNGGPLLTKEIHIGGVLVTEEIQRQMGVSYEEAEDLKHFGDENGNIPEEIVGIISNFLENLMTELRKVLNFYIAAGSTDRIETCFVCGGNSRLPGVIETLSDLLGIQVEILNPFENISVNTKSFTDEELENIASCGVVALGLALRKI